MGITELNTYISDKGHKEVGNCVKISRINFGGGRYEAGGMRCEV